MATPQSETFVRSFARGLTVIDVLSQGQGPQSLGEIARGAGLSRTATRRFLLTLIELSMVDTDGKDFWLTPRVLGIGLSYLATLPYWNGAQLALEELCEQQGQSCALSVLDDQSIVYLLRQHAKRILPMSPSLGSRLPAHAVSMGRVLLADLDEGDLDNYLATTDLRQLTSKTVTDPERLREELADVGASGYSWTDSEYDESIAGLAVPVRGLNGSVLAAINISLPSGDLTPEAAIEHFLPPLQLAASRIRASLPDR
ncbi:MAG: helix-turn-helix domain-containing protein [Actinomycetia bacterium]|nr:helix-turn-helix domain-containing protein [Actinomycetes bacterium]